MPTAIMASPSILPRLASRALDLLFPPRCVACGAFGHLICPSCQAKLPRALPPRCPCCWNPQPAGHLCYECGRETRSFQAARSPFIYDGPAREMVLALKYDHLAAIAAPMASLMARYLRDNPLDADVIVPVPLFGRRQRLRGYNQSALLAKELSRELGLGMVPAALRRLRNTPPQARSADITARIINVAGAFQAEAALVRGKRVLLIDDVMTTGATLDASAGALRQAGASAVCALTFARED